MLQVALHPVECGGVGLHGNKTSDLARCIGNRRDVDGDPVSIAIAIVIEDLGAYRVAGSDFPSQPRDFSPVGQRTLQDLARHPAQHLCQGVTGVPTERRVDPLDTSHGVGDQHQVVGVICHQRHAFEFILGQLLLGDIVKRPNQALTRHQCHRHFHPAHRLSRAIKPQQGPRRMVGRSGVRQRCVEQGAVLGQNKRGQRPPQRGGRTQT